MATPWVKRWANASVSVPYDRVRTATVTRGDLVRDVSVQGRIVAAVSPTLYATESGTITLHVEAGEQVLAGQVLASVDSPDLASLLQQAESALEQRKMELERQRIESRQQALDKRKAAEAVGADIQTLVAVGDMMDQVSARQMLLKVFRKEKTSTATMAIYHYVDGMTLEEVAELCKMSVSGVRLRLRQLKTKAENWES